MPRRCSTFGAEVDALAGMYGGRYTTMALLVSSGSAKWGSPLMTALAFGYLDAQALVRRGARVVHLAAAAGLGRLADARQLLATADPERRHRELALAAQHGHVEIVRLLLDAGEGPSRYNPDGNHSHSTPLHQAVLAGHDAVLRLLSSEEPDWTSKPLGWAMYAGQTGIERCLRDQGAKTAEAVVCEGRRPARRPRQWRFGTCDGRCPVATSRPSPRMT